MLRPRLWWRQTTAKGRLLVVVTVLLACIGAGCGVAFLVAEPQPPAEVNGQPRQRTFVDQAARGAAQMGDWLRRPRVPWRFIARLQRAFQRLWERLAPETGADRTLRIAGASQPTASALLLGELSACLLESLRRSA